MRNRTCGNDRSVRWSRGTPAIGTFAPARPRLRIRHSTRTSARHVHDIVLTSRSRLRSAPTKRATLSSCGGDLGGRTSLAATLIKFVEMPETVIEGKAIAQQFPGVGLASGRTRQHRRGPNQISEAGILTSRSG